MLTYSKSNIGRSAYANAFEFEPHDFATGGISPPEIPLQSDLRCWVDSRWALLQISSFYIYCDHILPAITVHSVFCWFPE